MEKKTPPPQFNFIMWVLEVCWVLFILTVMSPFVLLGFVLTGSFNFAAGLSKFGDQIRDFVNDRR